VTRRLLGRRSFALLLAAALAIACGSSPTPESDGFGETPLTVVQSDSGALTVSVWTSPDQPPTRGNLTLQLLVQDATTGAPVDGLTFEIVPTMPSMGHGTSDVPKTKPSGDGYYVVSDVNLFMAGRWELRMTITGAVNDVAIVQIDVS
jgi:hypothetical protein